MARRILILGGARFHGYKLAQFFCAKGDEVYVLNRGRYRLDYTPGIIHIRADRNNYQELKAAVKDRYYHVVIDNSAYDSQQIEMLLNLLQSNFGHYIFTSTVATYLSLFSDHKLKEEEAHGVQLGLFSPKIKEYALKKYAAEKVLQKQFSGTNFTILRFPNIFGEGDFLGKLAYFYYRLRDGERILLEKQVDRFNVIYCKDVVRIIDAVAGNYKCFNKILNVCDPQTYNYNEFFAAIYGKMFSPEVLLLMDAQKLWADDFYLPFAWGPVLDTTSVREILGNIDFIPLSQWWQASLEWEIKHCKSKYQGADYECIRNNELKLIERYTSVD